ncbi:putative reverse transcriptase domain-containing protein [Tanacetum coccineum]|uniref:Reverse transcriptase domain-containing protein n=1 Tax=Tanacetum coccineum TaxID=301880 RepID=A0ABQ4WKC9_9ASTR
MCHQDRCLRKEGRPHDGDWSKTKTLDLIAGLLRHWEVLIYDVFASVIASARLRSSIVVDSTCWSFLSQGFCFNNIGVSIDAFKSVWGLDPRDVSVPVIGGHVGVTVLSHLSQIVEKLEQQASCLHRIQTKLSYMMEQVCQRPGDIYISIPSDDRVGIVDCIFEIKVRDLIKILKGKELPGRVTGEAEKQQLQREELELEFQAFKQEINICRSSDLDTRREISLRGPSTCTNSQEGDCFQGFKDSEFMTLEAMADQVKSNGSAHHISKSPSKNLEENASITRGFGSPFKYMALGWHLEEIHVTWAHLGKKRTRLQLYTKVDEEIAIQWLETASQIHATAYGHQRDENANPFVPVPPNGLHARITRELNELRAISAMINSHLKNIDHIRIIVPPNEIDIDDLELEDELINTPLISHLLDSDDESDDGEVVNELDEYGNAGNFLP